jgi:GNAT superfamily N-acetyltransferase
MENWLIERLARSHERGEFACGKEPLDKFLRQLVSQYEKRDLGRTYVAVRPGESTVRGYYTLSSGSISFQHVPAKIARKLPKHPVPVALLGRLAIDRSAQGQGLGGILLADALRRCAGFADNLGIHAVEVHALDDEAKGFYEHYGFLPLLDDALHLYLPVATIRGLFGGRGSV